MLKTKCYIPVKVEDELPTYAGIYTCIRGNIEEKVNYTKEEGFFDRVDENNIVTIRKDYYTDWLKSTEEEVYVLTVEELLKFIKDGWEFYKNNFLHSNIVPEDFIKSLNP